MVLTDRMMGCKASTFAKCLSAKLAEKWWKPYLQVCGYINVHLIIAIVRTTHIFVSVRKLSASSQYQYLLPIVGWWS
jgi:hypothetical protein